MPAKGRIIKPKTPRKGPARKSKASTEASLEKAITSSTTGADKQEEPSSSPATVYFWRETHPTTGYLSQWYDCPFTDDEGKTYKSAEHYMMHHKALLFKDDDMATQILEAEHPRQVRALGRKVINFDDKTWNKNRERIVRQGTLFKFTRPANTEALQQGNCADSPPVETTLRALLLSTGDSELVEASPFDRIWGVGFKAETAPAKRERWGLNLLGKILMAARETFRKEDEEKENEKGVETEETS